VGEGAPYGGDQNKPKGDERELRGRAGKTLPVISLEACLATTATRLLQGGSEVYLKGYLQESQGVVGG